MARMEDRTREKAEYEPMMIAFNNCVFDWGSLDCLPHDPERVVFHYIPHDLDVGVLKEALVNGVSEDLAAKYTPKPLGRLRTGLVISGLFSMRLWVHCYTQGLLRRRSC